MKEEPSGNSSRRSESIRSLENHSGKWKETAFGAVKQGEVVNREEGK